MNDILEILDYSVVFEDGVRAFATLLIVMAGFSIAYWLCIRAACFIRGTNSYQEFVEYTDHEEHERMRHREDEEFAMYGGEFEPDTARKKHKSGVKRFLDDLDDDDDVYDEDDEDAGTF